MAELIAHGEGNSGPGWEYLENTVDHLAELGIRDKRLADLRMKVRKIRGLATTP
jgi:cation transport regulator ChaC